MKRKFNSKDFESQYVEGTFSKKSKGKVPSKPRQAIPLHIITHLKGKLTKNMPFNKFLEVMNSEIMSNEFRKEKRAGKVRRGVVFTLLSLLELTYPSANEDCSTELACLELMLKSKFVTKSNYKLVYEQMDELMESLFDPEDFSAEATKRSSFLDAIKSKPWYKPVLRAELLSERIFNLGEESSIRLQRDRDEKTLVRLKNVIKVDEYDLLQKVRQLKDAVKKRDSSGVWWYNAVLLVQAAVGSRFIEVLCASEYEVPTEKKWDKDVYIVIRGVAKESRKTAQKFRKDLKAAADSNNGEALEKLASSSDQDLMDVQPEFVIVKPVLFTSPQYIVDLVRDIRDDIKLPCSSRVEDRRALTKRYLANTVKVFDKLWGSKYIAAFRNKTHTHRKIYGSYSNLLFNSDGNLNLWLMDKLGHTSITTSFSYANLVVRPHAVVPDQSQSSRITQLEAQVAFQNKELKALKSYIVKQIDTVKTTRANLEFINTEGEYIEVLPFQKGSLHRKFKEDEDAKRLEFIESVRTDLVDRGVDLSKTSVRALMSLNVPKRVGTEVLKMEV